MNRQYTTNISEKARFEDFEVDLRAAEVRQNGHRIKLQEKSFQILSLLLERAGDIVTREELKQRLWPMDPLIHFEENLNTNLNRLRRALGDSANEQKFIRTIPRQGYRFCPPVTWIDNGGGGPAVRLEPSVSSIGGNGMAKSPSRQVPVFPAHPWVGLTLAFVVILALGGFAHQQWLRHSAQASGGPHRDTILVTPFEDLSGDPSQQYLSDGLTAEMITRLGAISPEHLSAIARSTAMQYKGAHKPVEEMAQETHADYVLEGSFQRQGDRVRITAELFRTRDHGSIWTKAYDRMAQDLLTIQREVADSIAESLSLEVLTPPGRSSTATNAVNPEAYDAYLKGMVQLNVRSREDIRKSIASLELASRRDAQFAPAYAALAGAYSMSAAWGYLGPTEGYRKARSAAQKALAIDDTLADAHLANAEVLHEYDWDWAGAEQEYIRGLELNPSSAMGHVMYANYLTDGGRYPEGLAEVRRAQQLDPSSLLTHSMICFVHLRAREYDAGIQECTEDLELDPQFWPAHVWLAYMYIYTRRYAESVAEIRRALESSGNESSILPVLAMAEGFEGNTKEAKRLLGEIRAGAKQAYVAPYDLAGVYIGLGDKEEALAMLAKSLDAHDAELVFLATAPEFDGLRDDPRFQAIIKRIGFPESAIRLPSPLSAELRSSSSVR
jgi:TolB-like protein/DNA-binding winged helix-turn-helix (wHTH) protein/tetratricopeptide (TPR) repeat protein